MSRVVNYHLVGIQTGTQAGVATARILNKSRLIGCKIGHFMNGGAGFGVINCELALNNSSQSNADTSNPPRLTTLVTSMFGAQNSTVNAHPGHFIPLDLPLAVGDEISLNQTQIGTAPSTNRISVDIYVTEG